MLGQKHLIQCHCILPQFKNKKEPTFHKFTVFSLVDEESDTVDPKYVTCNNCGALHKVFDLCKSEIVVGKEDAKVAANVEDFKISLPSDLFDVLSTYSREIPDFEMAQYILDYEKWDSHIVLSREELEGKSQGKILRFLAKDRFRIESYSNQEVI